MHSANACFDLAMAETIIYCHTFIIIRKNIPLYLLRAMYFSGLEGEAIHLLMKMAIISPLLYDMSGFIICHFIKVHRRLCRRPRTKNLLLRMIL